MTTPAVLRDARGHHWLLCPDGRYVMQGDSPKFARTIEELRSPDLAHHIGEVSELSPAGWCKQLSELAIACDPTLTLVRGWYHDPVQGSREHWWTTRPDGTIHDPSSAQFGTPGVAFLYEEFDGTVECEQCGRDMTEAEALELSATFGSSLPVCSERCFRRMVGL